VLLEAGVCILEGLDLRRVEPGEYELMALPMLIAGSDGAPTRVLLRPR
jgi:arylformamidase